MLGQEHDIISVQGTRKGRERASQPLRIPVVGGVNELRLNQDELHSHLSITARTLAAASPERVRPCIRAQACGMLAWCLRLRFSTPY